MNPGNKEMPSAYPWVQGVGVQAPVPGWGVWLLHPGSAQANTWQSWWLWLVVVVGFGVKS